MQPQKMELYIGDVPCLDSLYMDSNAQATDVMVTLIDLMFHFLKFKEVKSYREEVKTW